jgi:hypothetical protein
MTNPDRGSRRRSGGCLCRGPVAAALGVAFSLALLQSLGAQVWDEPMAGAQAPGAAVTGAQAADATLTGAQMSDADAIGFDTGSRELSLAAALSLAERQADALKLERSSLTRASLAVREARARLGPELTFSATGAYLSNPPGITV